MTHCWTGTGILLATGTVCLAAMLAISLWPLVRDEMRKFCRLGKSAAFAVLALAAVCAVEAQKRECKVENGKCKAMGRSGTPAGWTVSVEDIERGYREEN